MGNIETWTQQTDSNPPKVYGLEYDPADQLVAATQGTTTPPATLKRYRYAYDPAGNRTAEQIDDGVTGASYDNMNRLTSQQPGGAVLFRGTVNEPATVMVGGRPATVSPANEFTGQAPVPSGTSTVQVQATDSSGNARTNTYELSQTGATKAFTYDANGNLQSDGTKTYQWNAENRLITVNQGASTLAAFTYDARGRRATKAAGGVTTSYVYDGAQFLEERRSVGATTRYVYGPGIDQVLAQVVSGTATYNVADHLGSVVRTTDTAGNPTLTREYDPWGNLLAGGTASGYAFTGREWDPETGLYYYRARYFAAPVARFVSEDPSGLSGHAAYRYADNNPVRFSDPMGLVKWDCTVRLSGVGLVIGIGRFNADCEACGPSKQLKKVEVRGNWYGGTFGVKASSSASKCNLWDERGDVEPDEKVFWGNFKYIGGTAAIGPAGIGGSVFIMIGEARSWLDGGGVAGWKNIDASVSILGGRTTAVEVVK